MHCIEDWAKRRDTEVECFVGSRRTTGWGKQNPSRVPTFLKWSTIALSYSFWEKICLRESFLFWEAISSYSLILEYLLFERVLMFETNWHLFGQNEKAFLVENFASCLQSCSCIRRSTQIYVLLWSGHFYVRIAIWNRTTAIKEHNYHFLLLVWCVFDWWKEKTLDLESTTWPQQ